MTNAVCIVFLLRCNSSRLYIVQRKNDKGIASIWKLHTKLNMILAEYVIVRDSMNMSGDNRNIFMQCNRIDKCIKIDIRVFLDSCKLKKRFK